MSVDPDQRVLTLPEVADELGVHYMTVYRYVRSGKLPATKDGGDWRVLELDLAQFRRRRSSRATAPRGDRGAGCAEASVRLRQRLAAADEPGALLIVEELLLAGVAPGDVVLDTIGPAMRAIGAEWAAGRLSVAAEHRATTVAGRLLDQLTNRSPLSAGRPRGLLVTGALEGDHHGLAPRLLAAALQADRYRVIDLGAHTPAEAFGDTIEEFDPTATLVAVTMEIHLPVLRRTVEYLAARHPGHPVLVGGPGISGADLGDLPLAGVGATGREALALVESLAG